MTEKWCEDWEFIKGNWQNRKTGITVADTFRSLTINFCPICGAPRPAPKKTMGEELRHVYQNSIFISENQAWDRIASRAKEVATADDNHTKRIRND